MVPTKYPRIYKINLKKKKNSNTIRYDSCAERTPLTTILSIYVCGKLDKINSHIYTRAKQIALAYKTRANTISVLYKTDFK